MIGFDVSSYIDLVSPDIHYQQCRERGIIYGSSFNVIANIKKKNNAVLGKVVIPEMLTSEISQYCFHPALLDACLQLVFAALAENLAGFTYIPVKIENLCFYQLHQNTDLWSSVKIKQFTGESLSTITLMQIFMIVMVILLLNLMVLLYK